METAIQSLIREQIKKDEIERIFEIDYKKAINSNNINDIIKNLYTNLNFETERDFFDYLKKNDVTEENLRKKFVIEQLWNQLIVNKYNIELSSKIVERACELIHPQTHHLPQWWYQIIANDETGIDVDKFDYLLRDTQMTGMVCNDIDVNRFIDYARVVKTVRGHQTVHVLCYPEKLQFDINQLFLTRHRLHAQVYQHPTVRSYEMMYTDILHTLKDTFLQIINDNQTHPNVEWLTEWTDDIFTNGYLQWFVHQNMFSSANFNKATQLLQRIHTRKHYMLEKEIKHETHEERQTYLKTLDTEQNRVDIVTIGYAQNPLFHVSFYDKKHHDNILPVQHTSAIFPYHSQDYILRIYTK